MTSDVARRVLIVEDDISLRRLLELRLGMEGFETRCAGDGAAALEALREWPPSVVVTDVMMPRMSGLELCRQLRGAEATRDLPIVLLTARCVDPEMREVLALGAISHVAKPYDAPTLREALLAALDSGGPTPSGERPLHLAG